MIQCSRLAPPRRVILKPLERWPDLLLGMIQLNANNVPASLDALNRWLRDGPMLGVYFPGGGPGAMTCTHPNYNPLVERIADSSPDFIEAVRRARLERSLIPPAARRRR